VDDYPHQFSGGMLQRAMIAMAIALNPRLLIADEPTTALDVTVQAQILRLMRGLQKEFGTAIIMITHDLGVVAGLADEVMVMYAGRTMERAPPVPIYYTPHHPYTNGLLSSLPRADTSQQRLTPIRGQPPSMISPPAGCPFHPRCRFAMQRCHDLEPPLTAVGTSAAQLSSCWLPPDLLGGDPATDERREAYARGGRPAEATPEDPTRPVASGATAPRTA
jgi:oligopeptide/dipeptide ABC transporter ATP-binding protein